VDAVLHVSVDVPDADVFVKLVDVYPDGTAYNVAWSALRLRYRESMATPTAVTPGTIYEIRIKGMTTANYFGPGHQVRLEVAGSNFPLADRNWHTGAPTRMRWTARWPTSRCITTGRTRRGSSFTATRVRSGPTRRPSAARHHDCGVEAVAGTFLSAGGRVMGCAYPVITPRSPTILPSR
jgi:predicted acyl esterase